MQVTFWCSFASSRASICNYTLVDEDEVLTYAGNDRQQDVDIFTPDIIGPSRRNTRRKYIYNVNKKLSSCTLDSDKQLNHNLYSPVWKYTGSSETNRRKKQFN